jgi:hypothetical protein
MDPLFQRHGRVAEPAEPNTDFWTVPDLLDFDYYVNEDERRLRESTAARKPLVERDRRLYREQIELPTKGAAEHTPRHRRLALRRWLTIRRRAEDPLLRPLLPGATFARAQRLVSIALGVLGFIAGISVASALLHYDGKQPVNVSWYIFVLVILQILLTAAAVLIWYGRRSAAVRDAVQDMSLLGHLIKPLFLRAARWVRRQRLAHVPSEARDRVKAKQGLLEAHYTLYGPAAYLPMLIPAQMFGIGFNLGAVLVTLALEGFSDLAFGWGSALNVAPETIHSIVRAIALPWSWLFGEGVGVPTLAQVEGTRISLKDPLYMLSAEHLRSWRWFLVLSVFTYGLVPRLMLLGHSVLTQRRTLAALPFTHRRTQALYARMVTPSVDTAAGSGTAGPAMAIPAPLKPLTGPRVVPRPGPRAEPPLAPPGIDIAGGACVLMIHVDIVDVLEESDHGRLQQMLMEHTGWRVAVSATFGGGRAATDQAVALIENTRWQLLPARIALIQDGSQPPITESLRFLRTVRAAAGEQAEILLALVGDPDGEDSLPPLSQFDFAEWQRKIEQLGDPYLRLEMLAGSAEKAGG